jgi:MFS transporter, DHA2 family, multidrug resistance protein
VTFAAISATALLLFIPWELNRPQPLIDIKMLTGRQFGTCFVIMLVTGALLIATTQIMPQLLQEEFGYTATLAGLAISPGGAVTMVMMVVVGRLGFVQPRYGVPPARRAASSRLHQSTLTRSTSSSASQCP